MWHHVERMTHCRIKKHPPQIKRGGCFFVFGKNFNLMTLAYPLFVSRHRLSLHRKGGSPEKGDPPLRYRDFQTPLCPRYGRNVPFRADAWLSVEIRLSRNFLYGDLPYGNCRAALLKIAGASRILRCEAHTDGPQRAYHLCVIRHLFHRAA